MVEELNIRLTGFGGTAVAGKELNEFTAKTEAAVKQFQRDYMGVPETGKVCGKGAGKTLGTSLTTIPRNFAPSAGDIFAKKSCTTLAAAKDAGYEKYKGGVTKPQAEEILKNDVARITDRVAV